MERDDDYLSVGVEDVIIAQSSAPSGNLVDCHSNL